MVYEKELANGLYDNKDVCDFDFFVIARASPEILCWIANFRPDGAASMVWAMWMYVNQVAVESRVLSMSARWH